MLTAEMNQRMTSVMPGTPGGELLRRYWHPVAAVVELKEKATKKVRILGEDLALYRDGSGTYGLLAENCPHRRVSLVYGVPEEEGIRCPYHGWLYDAEGNCLEQPAESPNSTFKDRIHTVAYPVREMGGLLFTYMGPGEAPELPHFDYYTQPNSLRQIYHTLVPANWLQIMENSMDPLHLEWLHYYYGNYVATGKNAAQQGGFPQARHSKIGFDVFRFGIYKRRYYEGGSEQDKEWRLGHPVLIPNILKQDKSFQIRVPVDDTHTDEYRYNCYSFPGVQAPPQDEIPIWTEPYLDESGMCLVQTVRHQDMMAWVTQGMIGDRTVEHLGASDRGVLVFRKVLQEQMLAIEAGEDPLGVIRDPADNPAVIHLPHEHEDNMPHGTPEEVERQLRRQFAKSPILDQLVDLHMEALRIAAAS